MHQASVKSVLWCFPLALFTMQVNRIYFGLQLKSTWWWVIVKHCSLAGSSCIITTTEVWLEHTKQAVSLREPVQLLSSWICTSHFYISIIAATTPNGVKLPQLRHDERPTYNLQREERSYWHCEVWYWCVRSLWTTICSRLTLMCKKPYVQLT